MSSAVIQAPGGCQCEEAPTIPCPTNCDCDGTDVSIQGTSETQTTNGGICNAIANVTSRVFGTVTDANGTWKLFGLSFNGTSGVLSTSCYNGSPTTKQDLFGPRKSAVSYYFDFNDFENPCVVAGTQTMPYTYTFSCVGDGTVSLSLGAPVLGCSWDGLTYYAIAPTASVGLSTIDESIVTPSCDGSSLTASFTFSNLSGGQAPPSGTASVSVNLAELGYRCCQYFQFYGCNGLPLRGASVRVVSPGGAFVQVTLDSAGQAVTTWNAQCTGMTLHVEGEGKFLTINDTRDFTTGATTTETPTLASGQHCYAGCAWPVAETIVVSFIFASTHDFTWNGTNWVASFSYGGHAYVCTLTPAGDYSLTQDGGSSVAGTATLNSCFIPGVTSFSLTLDSGALNATLGTGSGTE